MATKDKPNNRNLRALFSVICLCIIALGLIVYFSTQSVDNAQVNEATTVKQTETTEVQKRVTVKETTTQSETTKEPEQTTKQETTATTTTEQATMEAGYKYSVQILLQVSLQ